MPPSTRAVVFERLYEPYSVQNFRSEFCQNSVNCRQCFVRVHQINKIINNSTTSSNKKSPNQKDSSTTVTSENVDNVDVVIIKITVSNEIIFEEINSKNYSKKI